RGGVLVAVEASFQEEQSLEARFTGVATAPGKVYVARVQAGDQTYPSSPIVLTRTLGAATGIFVYPSPVFGFHAGAELDDQRMFFQVRATIINPTAAPRDTGPDGLV